MKARSLLKHNALSSSSLKTKNQKSIEINSINREKISRLSYNNFVQQIKASQTFNSSMKNIRDLTEKKEEKENNSNYYNNDIKPKYQFDRNKHSQFIVKQNKENSKSSAMRNNQNRKNTLDTLLSHYSPIIINLLAFTRSDKPNAKVFIRNKYAELF